jgi:predicted transcriptional regulator
MRTEAGLGHATFQVNTLKIDTMETMELHLEPELEAKINRIAAENHSGPDEYIRQVLEQHVEYDFWFREKVQKSLDRLDRGEFLTHEEVGTRIEKMFRH